MWPYKPLIQVKQFITGHVSQNLSLKEKIENDLNLKPSRHIKVAIKYVDRWLPYNEGFESEKHKKLNGLKLNPRRENPRIFLSNKASEGYRVVYGTFDFDECLHGAILINPEGRVIHFWHISQEGVDWEHENDTNIFPHGFEIAQDGSIVTAYDSGSSLTKYDYCGNILWRLKGGFHHSIAFEGSDAIWTWGDLNKKQFGQNMLKIDYITGKLIKKIPLIEVMEANPGIDIFGILQNDTAEGSAWARVAGGYWHENDIDPLPQELEQHYPNFSAGDLLVSLRSPNLVFVMDQRTLKVKWWRQGLTRRQHDPDWNDKGTITIFNNNMHRGYSNIMEVNPVSYEHNTIINGEKYSFYTWWRGKHQRMYNGGFLITSSDQGRVFEVDREGNLTFEFLNTYGDNHQYLAISEARFLPKDFFKELPQCN
jgi:hypothetical protein